MIKHPLYSRPASLALITAGGIGLAVVMRWTFLEELGRESPYVTFYPAVMLAGAMGGRSHGLAATALSAFLAYFWIQGGSGSVSEFVTMFLFSLSGVLVAEIGEWMRRDRERLQSIRHEAVRQRDETRLRNERLEREAAQRREAEEALKRTSTLMEMAMTAAEIAAFTQDRYLRYTWAFAPHLGPKAQEVLGRTDAEIMAAEDARLVEAIKRRVIERGEPVHEEVCVTRDNQRHYFLLHATPLVDSRGEVTGLTALTVDVTARKAIEDARRKNEERYQIVFEQSPSVILLIDSSSGAIVDVNGAAATYYGWSREELRQKKISDLNTLSAAEVKLKLLSADGGQNGRFVCQHRRSDGSIRDVEVFSGPVMLGNRELLHSTVHDVTERRIAQDAARAAQVQTELLLVEGRVSRLVLLSLLEDQKLAEAALRESDEKVRQFNSELEQRVQERTLDLQAAIKELEAFGYSVSHDLRAPLRAIDGFTRILQEDFAPLLGDEGKRVVGVILKEEQRMEVLIGDLLNLSRLGQRALELQSVDMRELATLVGQEAAAAVGDRVVRLRIESLPVAWADLSLIRQVWVNLLQNAYKYTRRRSEAEIAVGGQIEGGETVYFVADNGVGFDMGQVGRLFGVFQRLHRDEDYEGTGVGLALVKRVVERHGGRVWAAGRVGEGARFYFALPVPPASAGDPVPIRASASPVARRSDANP